MLEKMQVLSKRMEYVTFITVFRYLEQQESKLSLVLLGAFAVPSLFYIAVAVVITRYIAVICAVLFLVPLQQSWPCFETTYQSIIGV